MMSFVKMFTRLNLVIFLFSSTSIPLSAAGEEKAEQTGCKLPEEWRGRWFQNEFAQEFPVKIGTNTISKQDVDIGICRENDGDGEGGKYLFFNKDEKCTKCISFHRLHQNVLVYKESICAEINSDLLMKENSTFSEICQQVYDSQEFYLIKVNADFVPCPFRNDKFTFSYGSERKFCENSKSRLESCDGDTQFILKYEACYNKPSSSSKREEIQCIANWTDGGRNYFIARVKEDNRFVEREYRCFIYESFQDPTKFPGSKYIYNVSISGDASCSGLHSTSDGEKSLTLVPNEGGNEPCLFPSWFRYHPTWYSLSYRKKIIMTSKPSEILFEANSTSTHGAHHEMLFIKGKLVCQKSKDNDGTTESIILAHEIIGCEKKPICIHLSQISDSLTDAKFRYKNEILGDEEFETYCLNGNADPSTPVAKDDKEFTLITESPEPIKCPLKFGVYQVQGFHNSGKTVIQNCNSKNPIYWNPTQLTAGCNVDESIMEFETDTECLGEDSKPKIADAKCLGTWESGDKTSTFLIASFPDQNSDPLSRPLIYCFNITKSPDQKYINVQANLGHCISKSSNSITEFFMEYLNDCESVSSQLNPFTKSSSSGSQLTPQLFLGHFLIILTKMIVTFWIVKT